MKHNRYIVHVDMDAFFAAIEQRDNPLLRGKPVVIGADPKAGNGRGVVSTCSYEARTFGIRSAMPISTAYKKCQHGVFIRPHMSKYDTASKHMYAILYSFTPDIEPVSIDEAFLDISTSYHLFDTPENTCHQIKIKIKKEMGLTASVGLAPTKMAAKIASDINKPDGLLIVSKKNVLNFLWPLPIRALWGVGKQTEKTLHSLGIFTVKDLSVYDSNKLIDIFGMHGRYLVDLANGIDTDSVETSNETKSISNETTFDVDTNDKKMIFQSLALLAEKVATRLREENLKGKTVTLKLRTTTFKTYTRSSTLPYATNFDDTIFDIITALYKNLKADSDMIRLVGIRISKLEYTSAARELFDECSDKKKTDLLASMDKIKNKFGYDAIHRASHSLSSGKHANSQ